MQRNYGFCLQYSEDSFIFSWRKVVKQYKSLFLPPSIKKTTPKLPVNVLSLINTKPSPRKRLQADWLPSFNGLKKELCARSSEIYIPL